LSRAHPLPGSSQQQLEALLAPLWGSQMEPGFTELFGEHIRLVELRACTKKLCEPWFHL